MPRRIGVFGGAFDPITNGHLLQISEALNYVEDSGKRFFEQIYLVPSGEARYDKTTRLSAEDRLRLCELSVLEYFGEENANLVEIKRTEIETGRYLPAKELWDALIQENSLLEYWWIIGEDLVENIQKWKYPEFVLHCIPFFVTPRPTMASTTFPLKEAVSTQLPRRMVKMPYLYGSVQLLVSSTEARLRLSIFWARFFRGCALKENDLLLLLAGIVQPSALKLIFKEQLYMPTSNDEGLKSVA